MRKRGTVFLAIGIICFISGIVMIILHVAPMIIPVTMCGLGGAFIAVSIAVMCAPIPDEMVKRTEVLSGNYSFLASMCFLFALCFINYFFPSLLSTNGLLLIMMLFMSISHILIRQYLLRRGKAE